MFKMTSSVRSSDAKRCSGSGANCAPAWITSRSTSTGLNPPSFRAARPWRINSRPGFAPWTLSRFWRLVVSVSAGAAATGVVVASRSGGEGLATVEVGASSSATESGLSSTVLALPFFALRMGTMSSSFGSSAPTSSSAPSSIASSSPSGLSAMTVHARFFAVDCATKSSGVLAWDSKFEAKGVRRAEAGVKALFGVLMRSSALFLIGVNRFSLSRRMSFSPSSFSSSSRQHLLPPSVLLSPPFSAFLSPLKTFEMTLDKFRVNSPSSSIAWVFSLLSRGARFALVVRPVLLSSLQVLVCPTVNQIFLSPNMDIENRE